MSNDENKPNNLQPQKNNNNQVKKLSKESNLLKHLSPEIKQLTVSAHRVGPAPNPIAEKITTVHISAILNNAAKNDERAFEDAKISRKYVLGYVLISVAVFIFLTVYLVDIDKELWKEIVKLFAVFAGGFGSGFGVKSYLDRNR